MGLYIQKTDYRRENKNKVKTEVKIALLYFLKNNIRFGKDILGKAEI